MRLRSPTRVFWACGLVAAIAACDTPGGRPSESGLETAAEETGCEPHPELPYDGVDQDCDGADLADTDGDGYPWDGVPGGTDCDDADAAVNPGATEVCDWVDQDCDGLVDDGVGPLWYLDDDGDGYGRPLVASCSEWAGYVLEGTDCDDRDATIHPGAPEVCDGRDDDCDGVQADEDLDADADGQAGCEGDCDDDAPRVAGGNAEICGDGLDNDCDGTADEACVDDHCDVSVPTDIATIQGAIDAAVVGDTVCVEPGTYAESLDFGGKGVAVVGVGGSASTVLDVASGATTVNFLTGEGRASVLRGFTIKDGWALGIDGASPTLVDLVVQDTYGAMGGGIAAVDGAPALWGVTVRGATAVYGVKEHGEGGGVSLYNADAVLDDVLIEDCYAGSAGGGVFVQDSTVGLSNVVIRRNGIGGAWGAGAGIALYNSTANLTNVVLGDNVTGWGWVYPPGGGIYAGWSSVAATNVTVCDNLAAWGGGGLMLEASDLKLTNAVVCLNEAYVGGGIDVENASVSLRYSDVWENAPDDFLGLTDPTGDDGNVSVDPDFADSDYRLSATSPLIDAGDPSILDADGSRSDIGAWGGPGGDWVP
ncbi:hypothetical protein LBMAG42_17670 [Deltaproteobacteria bacterium]|nr:hypothetical protein LBMAG42_17670 [Deltaproteobacteria bacterium]